MGFETAKKPRGFRTSPGSDGRAGGTAPDAGPDAPDAGPDAGVVAGCPKAGS